MTYSIILIVCFIERVYSAPTKKQSVLTKIESSFEGKNMQMQCSVLSYSIEFYFHDLKNTIEIHSQSERNIEHKIRREKAIEQEKI